MRIPLEPPFSKRGRAAIAARCKRAVLTGCEGASPSASTILPAKRRQRRILLVSGRAERKSPCRIQFFCGRGGTVDASARGADGRKSVRVRFPLSAPIFRGVVKLGNTADSKPAGRHCPCRCESGRRDQLCGRAWNSRPGGLKNRCAAPARGRASRPGRTNFFGEWWNVYTRVSETRGRKPVQVQFLSRRPIFSAASNKSNSHVSPTGNRSATLRAAAIFGRLM